MLAQALLVTMTSSVVTDSDKSLTCDIEWITVVKGLFYRLSKIQFKSNNGLAFENNVFAINLKLRHLK